MADERSDTSPEAALNAEAVERRSFSTTRKGFDPNEVRGFLFEVARELRSSERRQEQLTTKLHEAERRSASFDQLDDSEILRRFGEQTAHLLADAHVTAAGIREQAQRDAQAVAAEVENEINDVRRATESKVASILAEAEMERERRINEADFVIAGRLADTERRCADLRRAAEVDAERYAQATLERCRELVFEAQGARERLLRDLARRSRIATAQVEQLRAGRERLLESYRNVRRSFDDVAQDLQRADAEARAASDDVATRLDGIVETSPATLIQELGLITDTSVPDDIDSVLRSWTNDDGYASTMFDGSSALASITDISSLLPGNSMNGDGPHLRVIHPDDAVASKTLMMSRLSRSLLKSLQTLRLPAISAPTIRAIRLSSLMSY